MSKHTVTIKLPPDFDWEKYVELAQQRLRQAVRDAIKNEYARLVDEYLNGEGDEKPTGFLDKVR